MAGLTLGIDLGPTSIGWALVDEERGALLGAGVRVFPEGVDRDTSGAEQSKSAQRRVARLARRQIERRARRKRHLRRLLVQAALLPESALCARNDAERAAWEGHQFGQYDPYTLRYRALDERLELHEIGRILLHLVQHRGFQSNRRADRARKKETSDMLNKISALASEIDSSGSRTLGEYLTKLRGTDPARFHSTRLRGRHTRRDMYTHEFDEIWAKQATYHPTVLTPELRERLHHAIFYQRPLRPPSPALVGRCELEPRLPRCPRADRRFQRFRLYNEVNNLRVLNVSTREERPLRPEERSKLIAYLSKAKDRKFEQIAKHLFGQVEGIRFNLERGGRDKLDGLPVDAALGKKGLLGKRWDTVPEDLKDRIVGAIIDDEPDRLTFLLGEAGLDTALAAKLLDETPVPEGYGSYSLHALKKLLPHMERGLPLTSRTASQPSALRAAGYLAPWERAISTQPYLPLPPLVTNPLVRAALHEVRKVVNAILRELVYKHGHTLARVNIELAREVRGTAAQRQQRSKDMRERERDRTSAADRIRDHGVKPSREAIERYLLWLEQGKVCVYSGRPISLVQLLGGEVDVDHILPRSRSLDNSLMNRVVCFRDTNRDKGDRTPHEWLAQTDRNRYEQVLVRSRDLPYPKYQRFLQETVELDDFIARQLVDTAYIATQVREYVAGLGAEVFCPKGAHTAELRWQWGLNAVLRSDALNLKNREDHRHHALDAIVIALTSPARLQQLARLWRAGGTSATGEILPEPWHGFRNTVEVAVNAINVSHRPRRKVSGGLHAENPFGRTPEAGVFVKRKAVADLSPSEIEKIRDPGIRRLIQQRLRDRGLEYGRGRKVDKKAWSEALAKICMPSGVPVNKVRLLVNDLTIRPIRNGTAMVKTGEVHHACVFELSDEKGVTRRVAEYTSLLEASDRLRHKQPVVQRQHSTNPDARFLMSLCTGDMLIAVIEGSNRLVLVSTLVSTQGRIHIVDANDARPVTRKKDIGKTPNSLVARKVLVDPLGRIRWARD